MGHYRQTHGERSDGADRRAEHRRSPLHRGYVNANSVHVTSTSVVPHFLATFSVNVTSNPPNGFGVGLPFLGSSVTPISGG